MPLLVDWASRQVIIKKCHKVLKERINTPSRLEILPSTYQISYNTGYGVRKLQNSGRKATIQNQNHLLLFVIDRIGSAAIATNHI
jgi:hypothetical protein